MVKYRQVTENTVDSEQVLVLELVESALDVGVPYLYNLRTRGFAKTPMVLLAKTIGLVPTKT